MAGTGTVQKRRLTDYPGSACHEAIVQLNTVESVVHTDIEDLAAGADITARAFWSPRVASYILGARVIFQGATTGVDGSNTLVIDLTNATQGVTIGTLTRTATNTANSTASLTLTAAYQDVAADDVICFAVTQGATADAGKMRLQVTYRNHEQVGEADGTAIS